MGGGNLTLNLTSSEFKIWRGFAWLVGVCGGMFRLYEYFAGRSLWLDEASIALNILRRGYLDLLTPLQYRQAAPVGWLWAEKLATQLFGPSEVALRLIPFLAGIACLPIVYQIGREIQVGNRGKVIGLFAMVLFAFSPKLIYYASEVKQYSSDALCACLVLWSSLRVINERKHAWRVAFITFPLCLIFSHPSLFTLGGAMLTLIFWAVKRVEPFAITNPTIKKLVMLAGLLLVVFFGLYFLNFRALQHHPTQAQFWERAGAFLSKGNPVSALFNKTVAFFRFWTEDLALWVISACIFGVSVNVYKRNWLELGFLLAPFVLVVIAAYLKIYPFAGRLLLFLTPAMCVLFGYLGLFILERLVRALKHAKSQEIPLISNLLVWFVVVALGIFAYSNADKKYHTTITFNYLGAEKAKASYENGKSNFEYAVERINLLHEFRARKATGAMMVYYNSDRAMQYYTQFKGLKIDETRLPSPILPGKGAEFGDTRLKAAVQANKYVWFLQSDPRQDGWTIEESVKRLGFRIVQQEHYGDTKIWCIKQPKPIAESK